MRSRAWDTEGKVQEGAQVIADFVEFGSATPSRSSPLDTLWILGFCSSQLGKRYWLEHVPDALANYQNTCYIEIKFVRIALVNSI